MAEAPLAEGVPPLLLPPALLRVPPLHTCSSSSSSNPSSVTPHLLLPKRAEGGPLT